MTGDPYGVLGLPTGAPLADVKRAYRRLAKSFHPDSAGEAALPRFLAIHEAYEAILSGRAGRPSTGRGSTARPGTPSWAADAARARATREAWRSARPGASGGSTRSERTGAGSGGGAAAAAPKAGPGTGERPSARRRSTRKATLGSTSYDDAVQERARRAAQAEAPGPGDGPSSSTWAGSAGETGGAQPHEAAAEPDRRSASARPSGSARPSTFHASRPTVQPGSAATPPPVASTAAAGAPAIDERLEGFVRWLGAARDPRARLLLALVGWPPLGVLADRVIGEATGCASFSASCLPPADLLPLMVGALLLGLLVAVPPLARASAAGTAAIALTAVPAAAVIVGPGSQVDPVSRAGTALVILGLAWLVGIVAVVILSRGRILRA